MTDHTVTAQEVAVHLRAHIAGSASSGFGSQRLEPRGKGKTDHTAAAGLQPFEMTQLLESSPQQGVPCLVATAELFGSPVCLTQAACT
jgi:hypothetical protein